ncbi:cadherin-like domain-containing protein, partial [Vibrio atypicus]|uniref:cadherin-like domain-containing protein n=1 Tax=Vibrio atypicus TaxID=558271 RepID=UPI00135C6A44
DYNGSDSFTVVVSDGQGGTDTITVNIGVTPVNDDPEIVDGNGAPLGDDISVTTEEDTPVSGTLNANDVDGDDLTFVKGNDPQNGSVTVDADGNWTYTPNDGYNGSDSFTVVVSDGQGGTDTIKVEIGITPVNGTPIIAIPESEQDGYVNAEEAADGIQVVVSLPDGTNTGDVVELRDSQGNVVGTHTVSDSDISNGDIIINVPTPEDGTYTYEASITDPQGNEGPTSNQVSYYLDTESPTIDLVMVGDGNISEDEAEAVTLSGSTENVEPGQTVTLTVTDSANPANSATFTTTVDANGNFSVDVDLS